MTSRLHVFSLDGILFQSAFQEKTNTYDGTAFHQILDHGKYSDKNVDLDMLLYILFYSKTPLEEARQIHESGSFGRIFNLQIKYHKSKNSNN